MKLNKLYMLIFIVTTSVKAPFINTCEVDKKSTETTLFANSNIDLSNNLKEQRSRLEKLESYFSKSEKIENKDLKRLFEKQHYQIVKALKGLIANEDY